MTALSGDIKVPGVGNVPKIAAGGGVLVVLVLIVMHYRKGSSPGTGTAAAGTDPYPPDGTTGNPADPNSIDPTTGLTYGNEGIGSGSATSAYGLSGGSAGFGGYNGTSYPWDGSTGNPNDPYSMDPSTGATYGAEGNLGTVANTGGGPPFTSNAAWSQYAENYLITTLSMDAGTVSSALGAYIAGTPVTPAQKDVIDQAVAIAGNPPVTGAGGYPPSIRVQSSPASNGTVTVPNVTGMEQVNAINMLKVAGLHPSYSPPPAGRIFYVDATKPGPGAHVQRGTLVRLYSEQKQYLPKGLR